MLKWFCQKNPKKQNKNKAKDFDPRSIGIESGQGFINESHCCYYKFLWSKCETKRYGQKNGFKLSGLAMAQSKSKLNLKTQFLELLTPQIISKL